MPDSRLQAVLRVALAVLGALAAALADNGVTAAEWVAIAMAGVTAAAAGPVSRNLAARATRRRFARLERGRRRA